MEPISPEVNPPELHSAQLALLLSTAIRQRDLETFRQTLRAIAVSIDDAAAKQLIRMVQQDLTPELQAWMNEAIVSIRSSSDD